ncbi:MAG: ABC transporter substrate-binding protein [Candidatus Limnocylindrales bacterium]
MVVSAPAEEGAGIITQARGLGIDVPIIGGNGFNSPAIIKNAGKDAEGVVVGAAWNSASQSPENQAFLAAYQAAYSSAPDQFATQAYTGVKLLAEAIKRAGSTDRQAIRDALPEIKDFPTPLGSFSFTELRDADHPAVVQIVKDGTFSSTDRRRARREPHRTPRGRRRLPRSRGRPGCPNRPRRATPAAREQPRRSFGFGASAVTSAVSRRSIGWIWRSPPGRCWG